MARVINSIVLASQSPRRLELLRALGLNVEVVPSSYHEPDRPELTPRELAIAHAREKCRDVAKTRSGDEIVVAADTVVDVDGIAYNKPQDARDAARMLRDLSGRTHQVHTAVAVCINGSLHETCETTAVTFFELTEVEIERYVSSGEPMDKAGGYGIQGYAATLVESINGDYFTVMGFPVARFARMLAQLGFLLRAPNQSTKPA